LGVRRFLAVQVTTTTFSLLAFDGFLLPDRTCIVDGIMVVAVGLVFSGCGLGRFFSLALLVWLHSIVLARAVSLVLPPHCPRKIASQ
jgi:hypothetical protein